MPQIKINLVRDEAGNANLTVYAKGQTYQANQTHPMWNILVEKALADDISVTDMFDIGRAVGQRLELSDRIAYAKGYLFLDGDRMDDALSAHIVRMLNEDPDVDVGPFVALLENILQNPSANSRQQLYRYIDRHKITITTDGKLVLYKYVYRNSDSVLKSVYDPEKVAAYRSGNAGPAIVNGAPHRGNYVPQDIGDVVSMPRSEVQDNPGVACSNGLHVGAWSYIANYECKLEIEVHPRDVVSVPSDDSERKIRVCRYKIIGELAQPYDTAVRPEPEPEVIEPVVIQPLGEEGDVTIESVTVEEMDEDPTIAGPAASGSSPSAGSEGTPDEVRLGTLRPVKHPTQKEFDRAKVTARFQRKGLRAYAEGRKKWRFLGGSEKDRKSWSVK